MLDPHGYTVSHFSPENEICSALTPPKCDIRLASDLRRKIFAPIRYIVPGYIAEGCVLLAGRPKLGKSWLVLDVALAIALGSTCLGDVACEQGEVLFLALEDNERRLQRRIDKLLGAFAEEWPSRFHYATEWPRANEGGIEAIRAWVAQTPNARLVVIDVLAMFKSLRGNQDARYEADYRSLKDLQALAGELGIPIIVDHHTRKSGAESGDAVEKISGTLGLAGAVDAFLVLDRDAQGTSLEGRGRDIEDVDVAVSFDPDACRWRILGDAGAIRRSDERKAVIEALQAAVEPMSPTTIMNVAGLSNRNSVDILLHRMVTSGEVERMGRGLYAIPGKFPPPGKMRKKERLEVIDGTASS
jgi:hypothetical protein